MKQIETDEVLENWGGETTKGESFFFSLTFFFFLFIKTLP